MGSLARFNLAAIAQVHNVKHFVETGTAQGDSLAMVCQVKAFQTLHSVEIMPDLAKAATARFASDARVQIWEGDSVTCLAMILRELPPEPCLFWLDAHFPGCFSGVEYDVEKDMKKRLPLADEIALIRQGREGVRDILLIDDARIYEPGDYGAPDVFSQPIKDGTWAPLNGIKRSLNFVREAYGKTHGVVVDHADQGYVMVFPRAA